MTRGSQKPVPGMVLLTPNLGVLALVLTALAAAEHPMRRRSVALDKDKPTAEGWRRCKNEVRAALSLGHVSSFVQIGARTLGSVWQHGQQVSAHVSYVDAQLTTFWSLKSLPSVPAKLAAKGG